MNIHDRSTRVSRTNVKSTRNNTQKLQELNAMIKKENNSQTNEAASSSQNSFKSKIFNFFKSDEKEVGKLIGDDDQHNTDINNNQIKLENISDEKKGRVKFAK